MPNFTLTGTVKTLFDPQTFASGFTKREFVVTTDDEHPQDIKFECVSEWCGLLDAVQPGDRVSVTFRLRGNLYKERYFVNLQVYQIERQEAGGGSVSLEASRPDFDDDAFEPEPF